MQGFCGSSMARMVPDVPDGQARSQTRQDCQNENTDQNGDSNESDHSGSRKRGSRKMHAERTRASSPISIGRTGRAQNPRGSPSCRDRSSSLYPDGFQVLYRVSCRVFHGGDPAFL